MAQVKLSWQIEGLHDGIQVEVEVDGWGGVIAVLPAGTTEYTHDFLLSELEQNTHRMDLNYTVSAFRGDDIRHGEPLNVPLIDSPLPELEYRDMGERIDGLNEVGLPSIYIAEEDFVPDLYGINVLVADYDISTEYGSINTAIGQLSESSQRKLASEDKTENTLNILRNAILMEGIDTVSLSEQLLVNGKANLHLLSYENAQRFIEGDSSYTPVLITLFEEMGEEGKVKILLDDFTVRMSGGDFDELALFGTVLEMEPDELGNRTFSINPIQLTGEMKQQNYAMYFVQIFGIVEEPAAH